MSKKKKKKNMTKLCEEKTNSNPKASKEKKCNLKKREKQKEIRLS